MLRHVIIFLTFLFPTCSLAQLECIQVSVFDTASFSVDAFNDLHFLDLGISGSPQYQIFQLDTSSPRFNQTYTFAANTHTFLFYQFGTKNDQLLSVKHTQVFNNYLQVVISYHKIKTDGLYPFQNTNVNDFLGTTYYLSKNKRITGEFEYRYSSLNDNLNGGIRYDSLFTQNLLSNRQVFTTNLTEASMAYSHNNFRLINNFYFDSIQQKFALKSFVNYSLKKQNYQDNPSSGYYKNIYLDSSVTDDIIEKKLLDVKLSFIYRNDSIFKFQLGYGWNGNVYNAFLTDSFYINHYFFGNYEFNSKNTIKSSVYAYYVLSGFKHDDMTLKVKEEYHNKCINIGLLGSFNNTTPSIWLNQYYSNNNWWDNDFKQVKKSTVALFGSFRKINLFIQTGYELNNNLIYFENDATPHLSPSPVSIGFLNFVQTFRLGKFYLESDNLIQLTSDKSIIQIPVYYGSHSLYFRDSLFDKSMNCKIGFSGSYFSSFYAPAFNPSTMVFYGQDETKIGNYARINFFIDCKVKEAEFYVHLNNISGDLFGYNYFSLLHYPAQDMAFYLGVRWVFNN